jgi:hypothetical protein
MVLQINKNKYWPKERIYSLNLLTTIMGKHSGATFVTDTTEILWLNFQLTFKICNKLYQMTLYPVFTWACVHQTQHSLEKATLQASC